MLKHHYSRRDFTKTLGSFLCSATLLPPTYSRTSKVFLPTNQLVLFDNFHSGGNRSYSLRSRLAAAQQAGYDGFEFVMMDTDSSAWEEAQILASEFNFSRYGFHWTTKAVVDAHADSIDQEIRKIQQNVKNCAGSALNPYYTLSLSGRDELSGPTVHESGSAKAQDRHWERAFKIIAAFDEACADYGIVGSLYPHTHWICDTPQSQQKILDGANAKQIGPGFCSHHWFGNKASLELDKTLKLPMMERLNYVVLTNGRFRDDGFRAVRFDEGDIDMAWILAKLYTFGYEGPISSQGWNIGGDPFISAKRVVDSINDLRARFINSPQLFPIQK